MARRKIKKEYDNISAKMIEYHNNEVNPFIKEIQNGYGGFKFSSRRCLLQRDLLEAGNEYYQYNHEFTIEYLIMNNFIVKLLDETSYNTCMELLNHEDEGNNIIGANMIYTLIETKKKEILEKCKN